MTDVTATQVVAHSVRASSLRAPALAVGRGIARLSKEYVRALVRLPMAYAHALEHAYVKPGCTFMERPELALDADGGGRDPSW